MTYNWPAPTDYRHDGTRDGQGWYKWDLQNQAACVAALNAESAVRYGAILYSSGYLQLAQTAALLRHLCCAPEASETVMAGFRSKSTPGPSTAVQVEGKSVIPFDPIVGQGTRIGRSVSITARLLMQSPFNSTTDPITYKVYLRTMPARRIDARSDYSSFYWTTRKLFPTPLPRRTSRRSRRSIRSSASTPRAISIRSFSSKTGRSAPSSRGARLRTTR